MVREWSEGAHGIYYYRIEYDEGPDGDNWSYIDQKTLCILDYRPETPLANPPDEGRLVAGPFPTLEAAKAAFVLLYGRDRGDR